MALGLRLSRLAWLALSGLFAAGALAGAVAPSHTLDWEPARALQQPWRAWSAAFVHWSGLHLAANLAGTALVAALGWAAGCGGRASLAWVLAWPLTHVGLLMQPSLAHYGGLSGVLHAGVAVASLSLVRRGPDRSRIVGACVLAGLLLKLLLEAPWQGPLRAVAGWDIAIAPAAHATGAVSGLLCAALLLRRRAPRPGP